MSLRLGVDTGGTYTDAVLVETSDGTLVASRKAFTTHHNLAVGINAALDGLPPDRWPSVSEVALSTTLATNAALEGLGSRVCCVLIGYDASVMHHYRLDRQIRASVVTHVAGRHDIFGQEVVPFDEVAFNAALLCHAHEVDAFAISSYLAPRNPEHEQRAIQLANEVTSLPVIAGGSLSTQLDSIRRATTATLNAGLLATIGELLTDVEKSVHERHINAPVMVVRGDGRLMSLELARQRPIETLFSGPAASAIGGSHVSGSDRGLVVDMGGTSTDIGILNGGRPNLTQHGAALAGWRTAIRAADVRSVPLGGDSRIYADPLDLTIGPQRVTPLSRAAHEYPSVRDRLGEIDSTGGSHRLTPVWEFYAIGRPLNNGVVSVAERRVLNALDTEPVDALQLAKRVGARDARLLPVDGLMARGLITRTGLTPTDLLHARGGYTEFDAEAAKIGCRIAARESRTEPGMFVNKAHEVVFRALGVAVLRRAIAEHRPDLSESADELAAYLLDSAASQSSVVGPLDAGLQLTMPLIAVGAPGASWLPEVARRLGVDVIAPDHGAVASAIGAASTRVAQEIEVLLRPQYARRGLVGFTVHSPDGRETFASQSPAREHALTVGSHLATDRALAAGAKNPRIEVDEQSWSADSDEPGTKAYLMETRFLFTATDSSHS